VEQVPCPEICEDDVDLEDGEQEREEQEAEEGEEEGEQEEEEEGSDVGDQPFTEDEEAIVAYLRDDEPLPPDLLTKLLNEWWHQEPYRYSNCSPPLWWGSRVL